MARNGSGTYSLPSGNPVTTGTTISSTVQNNTMSDIATALTQSLAKDGQTTPTANLPMGGYKHTGAAAGSARTDYATISNLQDGTGIYVSTVGGTADVITLTPSPAITSYTAGQFFSFLSSGANTTNVTVNVSGLGAKAITKNGTTALVANDIPSGALISIIYDGTRFQLVGVGASGSYLPLSGGTLTGNLQIDSTDAGASAGPSVTLYRNSATPAASDLIGQHIFSGEDSAGNTQTYATITGNIVDPTSTSEDGQLVFATVIAGTLANRMRLGNGVFTEGATGGDQGANTINASAFYDDGVQLTPLTSGTAQASTSGTAIVFTGIPSGVKRVTVMLSGVSTDGTHALLSRIGDSGGIEDASYVSQVVGVSSGSTGNAASSTAGMILNTASVASQVIHGVIIWSLLDSSTNTWVAHGHISDSGGVLWNSTVTKALSATLDRVSITTETASNVFDAGTINILYE